MNAKVVGNSNNNDSKLKINVHKVKHGKPWSKNGNGKTAMVFFRNVFY